MFTVVLTEKGGNQQRLEFDEELVSIGRVQGNQVVLPRGNVSKRHAKLELRHSAFYLTDLGSTNGTYVNGRRITEPTRIASGDKIYIGDFILAVEGHDGLKSQGAAPIDKDRSTGDDGVATSAPLRLRQSQSQSFDELDDIQELKTIDESRPRPAVTPAGGSPAAARRSLDKLDESLRNLSEELKVPSRPKLPRPSKVSVSKPPTSATPASPLKPSASIQDDSETTDSVTARTDEEVEALVGTLLDQVARQIKRVSRSNAPVRLDGGTAGKVRIVIEELVDDLVARGKLPPTIDTDELKGKVFRAVVDLGPLSAWLDDHDVDMIRVSRPDTIWLFKSGEWIEAPSGFVSVEGLAEIIRCLSAGLEVADGGGPGIFRFRLEEGYLVFAALPPGALTGPGLVIDKTTGKGLHRAAAFAPEVSAIIERSIMQRHRIAVVGSALPARLAVVGDILGMVSESEFVVSVEDLPLMSRVGRNALRLSVRGRRAETLDQGGVQLLLFHALELEPDWLVVSGGNWRDMPYVLSAAFSRKGLIAELPLASGMTQDRNLATAFAASGAGISPEHAAVLLEAAFDIMINIGKDGGSPAFVDRVITCKVAESGRWTPQVLYERKAR